MFGKQFLRHFSNEANQLSWDHLIRRSSHSIMRNSRIAVLQTLSNILTPLIYRKISFRTLAVVIHPSGHYSRLMNMGQDGNKNWLKQREFFFSIAPVLRRLVGAKLESLFFCTLVVSTEHEFLACLKKKLYSFKKNKRFCFMI